MRVWFLKLESNILLIQMNFALVPRLAKSTVYTNSHLRLPSSEYFIKVFSCKRNHNLLQLI